MAYPRKHGEQVYRSSDLDEVQGYDDLRTIWKYVKLSGLGKTPPLSDRVRAKIAKGLKRTMSEGKSSRTRNVAAAMALAIADGDWTRDVYRKAIKGVPRVGRASRSKGQGSGSAEPCTDGRDAEGQDASRNGCEGDG